MARGRRGGKLTPAGEHVADALGPEAAEKVGHQLALPGVVQEALQIYGEDARSAGALGYTARVLVQATMPHSNPGDVPAWGRENGRLSLVMQPGQYRRDGTIHSMGLPYGAYPRLLLAWLTTEAVRTKEPVLQLGPTLSGFMEQLGLIPTGGKWGTIPRLRDQMRRLFACSIVISYAGNDGGVEYDAGGRVDVARQYRLWWDPKNAEQAGLWESTVELTQPFFEEVTTRPVPIDMRALNALKRSPLRLDIYTWLTYRMFSLERQTTIPWRLLEGQFGSEYNDTRFFRRAFLKHLREVVKLYPVRVADTDAGLILRPSATHIPRRT